MAKAMAFASSAGSGQRLNPPDAPVRLVWFRAGGPPVYRRQAASWLRYISARTSTLAAMSTSQGFPR